MSTKYLSSVPVQLPEKQIYARLGYNIHKTTLPDELKFKIAQAIQKAFILCEPKGAWARISIVNKQEEFTELENGTRFESASLAQLLSKSHAVLLMASTVGNDIMQEISQFIEKEDGATAVIYDAVGSETADAAVGWINEYVRQLLPRSCETLTEHRYSPGYGDLGLENQKFIFEILELEKLELQLTERLMLVPEKSVIAIAGIEESC